MRAIGMILILVGAVLITKGVYTQHSAGSGSGSGAGAGAGAGALQAQLQRA